MSAMPTYPEFLARVSQPCRLARTDEEGVQPELAAVLFEVGERHEQSGYEQFSLVFHADEGHGPQQGMYAAAFDDGTRWELFLVPIARVAGRIAYEAYFNREPG